MLVAIQYPLVDSRQFVADADRLRQPIWPSPDITRAHVRSFGPVIPRPRGGIDGWVGEGTICNAHRAIQLVHLPLAPEKIGRSRNLRVAYQRFYADGSATGKLELGFGTVPRSVSDPDHLEAALEAVLSCPARVTCGNEPPQETTLQRAGKLVARKYLYSSTERSVAIPAQRDAWWVRAGQPLVIIESLAGPLDDEPAGPPGTRTIKLGDISVAHGYWPPKATRGAVRLWSIRARGREARDRARRLRVVLSRLHAEQQALHAVLTQVATRDELSLEAGPDGSPAAALLTYLNQTRGRVLEGQKKLAGTAGPDALAMAQEIEDAVRPGDREALLRKLEVVKSANLRRSLQGYVEDTTAGKSDIFISYAHADPSEHVDLVKTHLEAYTRSHEIRIWEDGQIEPGEMWRPKIDQAMNEAEKAVLMVTPKFLASPFIRDVELPRLHERAQKKELSLLWLPVTHSAYKTTVLKDYQALTDPKTPLDTLAMPQRNGKLVDAFESVFA